MGILTMKDIAEALSKETPTGETKPEAANSPTLPQS